MSVHMHEENAGLIPEEVVVESGDLQPVIEQSRHDGIDLILC